MAARRLTAILAIALVVPIAGTAAAPWAAPADAQTVTVNWIEWAPPASYGSTTTAPGLIYTYATTALGELQLPGRSKVYVKLTGEIVNPNVGTASSSCTGYCGPSGFTSDGTTPLVYWQQYPATGNGTAFMSDNLPSSELPKNGDHIGLVGESPGNGGNPTQLLEFFSDSQRTQPTSVVNLVMLIGSLGGPNNPATWDFTQDFAVLSDNRGSAAGNGSGLTRREKVPGGTGADFQVTGSEGSGAIQFVGSFTSLSWTVSAPELWASWNLGATSASIGPETPETPVTTTAAPTIAVDCQPDPVRPGGTVTCEITGGDPDVDILWRASIEGTFAEQGVTLDGNGRGTFAFPAPVDADGRTILVELVEWNAADTVEVAGSPLPARIPAGEGPPRGLPQAIVLLSLLLLGAGSFGRWRAAGSHGHA
jgi:hypothetical protein